MDDLSRTLYAEIRQIAAVRIRGDRAARSISATDLAHEAIARAIRSGSADGLARPELLARVARLARQVLVDHARRRNRLRHGGGRAIVQLSTEIAANARAPQTPVDVLAIDDALARLARLDARQAQIVELRYFGGSSVQEVADALGVSKSTVEKEERKARAWLELVLDEELGS